MKRVTDVPFFVVAIGTLVSYVGCGIEVDADQDRPVQITGRVNYQGIPVERGAIHFMPINPTSPSASGMIDHGEIKAVFTRVAGDGVRPGKYGVAITSFDEDLLKSVAKRNALGPDPVDVGKAADKIKKWIPTRYSNVRESGLAVEFTQNNHSVVLDLVD